MVDRWLVCRSRSRRMWGEWLFCQMIFRDWAFFCPGLHFRCGRGEMEVIPWGVHRCILGSRTSNPRHPFPPQPSPSIHSAPSPLEENWKWKKLVSLKLNQNCPIMWGQSHIQMGLDPYHCISTFADFLSGITICHLELYCEHNSWLYHLVSQ